jgi:hypothetical protein
VDDVYYQPTSKLAFGVDDVENVRLNLPFELHRLLSSIVFLAWVTLVEQYWGTLLPSAEG